jgi:hypothetical protein
LERWKVGWMLGALTGVTFDVIDVDPRNGGDESLEELRHLIPPVAGEVTTPGGGRHYYVPVTGHQTVRAGGIDYLGRGALIYLPGTERPKYGGAGYAWIKEIDWARVTQPGDSRFLEGLRGLGGGAVAELRNPARATAPWASRPQRRTAYGKAALYDEADKVAGTVRGLRNIELNRAAFRCGRLVRDGHLADNHVEALLLDAADQCGLLADIGEQACTATIRSGLRAGQGISGASHG